MTSDIDGLLDDLEAQYNAVVGLKRSAVCVARAESLARWIAAVEELRTLASRPVPTGDLGSGGTITPLKGWDTHEAEF